MSTQSAKNAELLYLQNRYKRIIDKTVRRFSVPSVLDEEDLQQQALMVLDEASKMDLLTEDDFRRVFRRMLINKAHKLCAIQRAKRRDWKLKASFSIGEEGAYEPPDESMNPEERLIHAEQEQLGDLLLEQLLERVSSDAKVLLFEILFIRQRTDEELETLGTQRRRYETIARSALVKEYGWSLRRLRVLLLELRREAAKVALELGMGDWEASVRA